MRPVRLELDGFASFRDPAVVDFTDADYVAFVGATGSGKSTLVDALTFALYGSAPRWESTSSIQYALAPTANRCTVRLIFDVGPARYAVAREVRRSGASIGQRNVSLERYLDPLATGHPAADEATEVLAGDPRGVRAAVAELLGLDFEDFCTCVVLPQGEFAAFLKASPAERQRILLKLLGARQYEAIGKAAGIRAASAATRAELLTSQLAGLSDATAEAEALLRDREAELAELHRVVSEEAAAIEGRLARRRALLTARADAADAARALGAVQVPDGVGLLGQALATAQDAYTRAREDETQASQRVDTAEQELAEGPERRRVERIRELRVEAAGLRSRQPAVEEEAQRTAEAGRRVGRLVEELRDDVAAARRADTAARARHAEAAAHLGQAGARLGALRSIRPPDDIDALGADLSRLHDRQRGDDAARRAAVESTVAAEEELARLPDRTAVEVLLRTVQTYASGSADAVELTGRLAAQTARADELGEVQQRCLGQVQSARDHRDAARTRAGAAALRPQLVVGHDCPVCTQVVTALPSPIELPALAEADAAVAEAVRAAEQAGFAADQARRAAADAAERLAVLRSAQAERDATLTELLPEHGAGADRDPAADRAAVDVLIARRTAAVRVVEDARAAVETAQQAAARTERERRVLGRRLESAWSALHATRGRLTDEHPPEVAAEGATDTGSASANGTDGAGKTPPADPVRAWRALADWAADRADQLAETEVSSAQAALDDAADLRDAAAAASAGAEQALADALRAESAATRAEERAGSEHARLVERLGQIATELTGEPTAAECDRLLAECDRLESAAQQARHDVRATGAQRRRTEEVCDRARRQQQAARNVFAAVRDQVLAWSPPSVDGVDLAADWALLAAWAQRAAAEQVELARRIEQDLRAEDALVEDHLRSLVSLLVTDRERAAAAGHPSADSSELAHVARWIEDRLGGAATGPSGQEPNRREPEGQGPDGQGGAADRAGDDLAGHGPAARIARIPALVELERERARGRTARAVERRRRAEALVRDLDRDIEIRQVAGELQRLMSARRFPQWLADAALDTLVADASASLLRLSNQQFDLTHDKGEFFVIDHADADSRRSVRTLSGGETFQASLALALALSEQLATLAAGGRTTLDSIFLDEGFGTLDPEALDTVAATLENLREDRMVGVITHVAALAERVPVRFEVSRDPRTSRVERVSA